MRKIYLPILVFTLCCLFFNACSSTNDEVFELSFSDSTEGFDFSGATWDYAVSLGYDIADTVLGYNPNTAFSDLASERISQIETDYNVNIDIQYGIFGFANNLAVSSSVSGQQLVDAIQDESFVLTSPIKIGVYLGLSEVSDYINIYDEDKWGTRSVLESVYWEDDLYGVVPWKYPELPFSSLDSVLIFNTDMIRSIGATDPRDFVDAGVWNWDKFKECLVNYSAVSDVNKVYSLSVGALGFLQQMAFSNGAGIWIKEGDSYGVSYYNQNQITAIETGLDILFGEYKDYVSIAGTAPVTMFLNDETVMATVEAMSIYGLHAVVSYQSSAFGILPFPQGPNGGEIAGYYAAMDATISIPVMAKDYAMSAIIIDALYEPFPGYETKESIIEYMQHSVFFDERDAEYFYEMAKNNKYNYFGMAGHRIFDIISSGNETVTKALQTAENNYENLLNNEILPRMRAINAIWNNK